MWFSSDNISGVHPEVLEALADANSGYRAGYGADASQMQLRDQFRAIFEHETLEVFLVPTGTAANVISLAALTKPWQTIYCHRNAHIEEDECGGPEFYTGGAKLTLIDGPHGKISPEGFIKALDFTARAGVHNVQKGPLSLTNTTEHGTVYSIDEIQALTKIAKSYKLPTHLDGARFANALVHLGCSPALASWKSGIDVLSFGGTKNGLMGVEAILVFKPEIAWDIQLLRKRGGHLFSKHRYLTAQMEAYLKNDNWLNWAKHANQMAQDLAKGLEKLGASFKDPVEANLIFASFPRHLHKKAHNAGAQYYFWPFNQSLEGPDDELLTCRLACSWSTTPKEIEDFLQSMK